MIRTILSSGLIRRLVIVALAATLAGMLSVAAFTSTGAAQPTKPETNVTGFSKGLTQRGFPSQGVPLLKTFFFQYVRCAAQNAYCFGQVDHHITQILIEPNFPAQ